MDQGRSILQRKEYGGIEFRFRERMEELQMNRNQLARMAGIRFEVANRLYQGHIERLDLDVLARVCHVLGCTVGEVVIYNRDLNKE